VLRRFGTDAKAEPETARPRTRTDTTAKGGHLMIDRYTDKAPAASSGTGELNALLGKGSEFDGRLSFEGTVRIDGTFTGEVTTNDMLIVGESAKVTAEVSCGTIIVHGEVNGNIKASQSVELHKPARVKGDVSTPSLMVERGVVFEGRMKMEDLEDKIVPMRTTATAQAD